MPLYNIRVSSNIIVEADTPDEAKRELQARAERIVLDMPADKQKPEHELLLNVRVEGIEVEPKWSEH